MSISKISHHLSCKPNSLCRLFSRILSLNHQQEGKIEDDWEYIKVLDSELGTSEEEEEDEDDVEIVDHHTANHNHPKMKYTVLSKDDVRQHLEDKITKVATVLSLPRNEAAILLQHFKWSVNRTNEEWLTCEENVRKAVGLFVKPVTETPADAAEIPCRICLASKPRDLLFSVSCGHQICQSCWEGYISEAINGGPQCLSLRCPNPFCDAALGLYSIELLSSEVDKKKFEYHFLRSYVDGSRKAKWCSAPDCNYVLFSSNGGEGNVTCKCLHCFCWSCSGEAHAPIDCSTLAEWISEKARQSEKRLLAYAVPCPRCNFAPIACNNDTELEPGYMRILRCTLCQLFFCCSCGGDWDSHRSRSENFGRCNISTDNGVAMNSILRYNRFYKEWEICKSYRECALADLKLFQDMQLHVLCGIYSLSSKQLDFLVEALLQVVDCWQFLKWTYVYGYYLPKDEHVKKHLFEFMQKEAVGLVKRLHKHIEEELQTFLYQDIPFARILEFRNNITKLTRVIRNYFDQLVKGLMDGLPDVVCISKLSPRLQLSPELGGNNCYLKTPSSEVMR